jgi:hypothetical protein
MRAKRRSQVKTLETGISDAVSGDASAAQLRKAIADALSCVVSIRGLIEACRWTEVDTDFINGIPVLIDAILIKPLEVATDSDEYQCLKEAGDNARHVMNSARELIEDVWCDSTHVPARFVLATLTMAEEMLRVAAATEASKHDATLPGAPISATARQEVGHGQ